MHLTVVGLSHHTAPVAIRELAAIPDVRLAEAIHSARNYAEAREVAIISTCNRTEIYAVCDNPGDEAITDFLCRGAMHSGVRDHLYSYADEAVVRHLFHVAAGADSMVLGEGQILGQVRAAARVARTEGGAGPVLGRLFDQAVVCGKRARTETEIARGPMSVSHVAVELARQIFGDLRDHTVLLLGAGETAELTARLIAKSGVALITVANRTFERAEALAASLGGQAIKYDQFPEKLERADIVLSSTAAPHAIITAETVRHAASRRRGRPVFFIDLAVPRDIEPAVGDLDNVFLYDMDDLQELVSRNLEGRRAELVAAGDIVEDEVASFMQWLASLQVVPVLSELQRRFEDIRQAEWERTERRLSGLTPDQRDAVDQMTRAMIKKMLHDPWRFLKSADDLGAATTIQALIDVFALEISGPDDTVPRGRDAAPLNADLEARKEGV